VAGAAALRGALQPSPGARPSRAALKPPPLPGAAVAISPPCHRQPLPIRALGKGSASSGLAKQSTTKSLSFGAAAGGACRCKCDRRCHDRLNELQTMRSRFWAYWSFAAHFLSRSAKGSGGLSGTRRAIELLAMQRFECPPSGIRHRECAPISIVWSPDLMVSRISPHCS
jgi:hypothetical protein